MKVAAAQISCSLGDPKANLFKVRDFSRRGSDAGVELIVFPEMTDTGYSMSVIQAHASSWTHGFVPGVQEIAAKFLASPGPPYDQSLIKALAESLTELGFMKKRT